MVYVNDVRWPRFCSMLWLKHGQCTDCGIEIVYNIDGHLIGSHSCRSDTAKWSELKFADDTAII